jgi:hypothetical protein
MYRGAPNQQPPLGGSFAGFHGRSGNTGLAHRVFLRSRGIHEIYAIPARILREVDMVPSVSQIRRVSGYRSYRKDLRRDYAC